ncbi:MAG: BON domain-containing protein [Bacteroidota bacterium]
MFKILFFTVMLTATLGAAISCKPKDADIQAKAVEAIKSAPGSQVTITDGVATLTGEVADEATRKTAESALKEVKGIEKVVNSLTVTPPPPPVEITADDALISDVQAALTSFSGVVANVSAGVVTLSGVVKKADMPRLMMAIQALGPKKVENKLTIK